MMMSNISGLSLTQKVTLDALLQEESRHWRQSVCATVVVKNTAPVEAHDRRMPVLEVAGDRGRTALSESRLEHSTWLKKQDALTLFAEALSSFEADWYQVEVYAPERG